MIPSLARIGRSRCSQRHSLAYLLSAIFLPACLAIPPTERLSRLSIRHWGAESGIPEETFASILATGDGYVWLASNDGLVRFDGQRATVFRLGEAFRAHGTGSCSSSALSRLLLGSDGEIWIGAMSGCIFRIVPDRFGSFANFLVEGIEAPTIEREPNIIRYLSNLPNGRGLEVTRESKFSWLPFGPKPPSKANWGANLVARVSNETVAILPPQGLRILFGARDAQSKLWAILSDNKLYSVEVGAWRPRFHIPSSLGSFLLDKHGNSWIGTANGLYGWLNGEVKHWGIAEGLKAGTIETLREDRSGCLWMGMRQSLGRLCEDRLDVIPLRIHDEEVITAIEEDLEGNIWAGGHAGSLYQLSPRIFQIYSRRDGMPQSSINGVAVDRDGSVWASMSHSLVKIVQGQLAATFHRPEVTQIKALAPDQRGGMTVASTEGIFHVDSQGLLPIRSVEEQAIHSPMAIFFETADSLLYSTNTTNYRLRRKEMTKGKPSWEAEDLQGATRIRQWTTGPNGRVWALAQYQGLHWLDGNTYRRAANMNPDRERSWFSISSDEAGLLWIGATDGLEIYSTKEERFLTKTSLLKGDQVFHTVKDRYGKMWCATRQGLVRFSAKLALEAAAGEALGKPTTFLVERFGEAQSLPTTNFGLVTSASGATDREGRMWFPGLQGLVSLDPAAFERTPKSPVPLMLQVSSDGTPKDLNQALQIEPGRKKIEFLFQTVRLDLLGGDFCRLQLQGFDQGWIMCNERRTAQYTNLPPGNYEFVLQTSSQAGTWNGKELRVPLSIEPAYYQRPLIQALAFLTLSASLGVVLLRRRRIRRERTRLLEEKVEERTLSLEKAMRAAQAANRAKSEFLATMSHEIRTPMNGVLGAAQLLAHSPLDAEQQKLMSVIQHSGEDLIGIVDDILCLSLVEAGKLKIEKKTVAIRPLCENLVSLFRPKAEAKGVTIHLAMEDSIPGNIRSDPQRLRQILLNLVGNAVKFTDCGEVRLLVTAEAGTICFHIEDTGLGIANEQIPTLFDPFVQADSSTTRRYGGSGLGLSIVRRFVDAMLGTIEVEKRTRQGLRVPRKVTP